jgi:hypothetical protein
MPTVNDQNHAGLEADVIEHLVRCGYDVEKVAYHDVMSDPAARTLSLLDTPTSLAVRTRADLVAYNDQDCFYVECKTKMESRTKPGEGNYEDMTVEAFPLALHHAESYFGVDCLYVYRDQYQSLEVGFWCSDLPPIRSLHYTKRSEHLVPYLKKIWREYEPKYLPGAPWQWSADYFNIGHNCGSGDAYVIVDVETLQELPYWQSMINNRMEEKR